MRVRGEYTILAIAQTYRTLFFALVLYYLYSCKTFLILNSMKKITYRSTTAIHLIGNRLLLTLIVLVLSLHSFKAATNTWTGLAHNGLWTSAANWSAGVPAGSDDVVIGPKAGLGADTIVSLTSTVFPNSVTINKGITLNISGSGNFLGTALGLTMNTLSSLNMSSGSELLINSLFTAASTSINISTTSTLEVLGSGGCTLNGTINVNATGVLYIAQNCIQNGQILVHSDVTGDGSLQIIGTNSGTGSVEVFRYITNNGWHMLSPAVDGETSGNYTNFYMKQWVESSNAYGSLITSATLPLTNGSGFAVFSSANVSIGSSGSFTNSDVSVSCPFTNGSHGFTLVGNPYTAAINLTSISLTMTHLSSTVWYWSPGAGNYKSFNYKTSIGAGPQFAAIGQGFFVQATGSGASIVFNNNAILPTDGTFLRTKPVTPKAVAPQVLKIDVSGNNYSDAAFICQFAGAQSGIDYKYDAKKLIGLPAAPQLFIIKANSNVTTASYSSIDSTTSIPLNLKVGADGLYTLSFQNTLALNGLTLLLHDNKTGSTSAIGTNFTYSCQATVEDDSARFTIFVKSPVSTGINTLNQPKIKVWSSNNLLHINIPAGETLKLVNVYDINGAKVASYNDNGSALDVINLNNLAASLYIVQVYTNKQVSNNKIAIQ